MDSGVAGEGRAEPQTDTAASRAPLYTLVPLLHPSPAIPSLLLGQACKGLRVRVPATMLELCCIHTGIILAKRSFLVHKFSFLFWAREEGREQTVEPGGQETNLP